MKKFYSVLAIAAAACLSAQAADTKAAVVLSEATAEVSAMEAAAPAPQKAPAKAAAKTMDELMGEYTGTFYLPFQSYPGVQTGDFAIVPTTGNNVDVYGICNTNAVPGVVDFEKGTITLEPIVDLGQKNFGGEVGKKQVLLKHYRWNDNGQGMYDASTTPVVWNIVDGGVKYADELDLYMGEIQGYDSWMVTGGYRFELIKNATVGGNTWYTVGQCSFVDDAFFLPNWSWTAGTPPTLTCDVQFNSAEPDLIGLYNPYGTLNALLGEVVNEGNLPGRIVLNVSNKQCVYMIAGYIGTINDGLWYGSNMEGNMVAEGNEPADLVEFLGADALSSYNVETGVIVLKNCLWSNGNIRLQSWKAFYEEYVLPEDPTERVPEDTFTIMLPEIDPSGLVNIAADQNAPVEYFNLQGMKVENPAAGLYIKRQGNTVTKVVL